MPRVSLRVQCIPDDSFMVKWRGEEHFVNGFFYVEDGTAHIIIAMRGNPLRVLVVIVHELLHYIGYTIIKNVDLREYFDDKINIFCKYLPDFIEYNEI